ncbi:MAG TPA: hypothetical protein VIL52_02475 [Bacteroidota bacterium]
MRMHRVLIAMVVCMVVCAVVSPRATAQIPSVSLSITGGLAMPMGDFASTSSTQSGGATTGFSAGLNLDISLVPMLTVVGSFSYVSNGISDEYVESLTGGSYSGDVGSWTTIWPMVGIKYSAGLGPVATIYFTGQGGLVLGSSPDADVTSGGFQYSYKSFSSSAFAYGFGAGVKIGGKFFVEIKLLGAQPEYDLEATASGPGFTSTFTGKYDQPTSIIQLNAGISL